VRMSRLSTLLLFGPAPPDAVAVWFEDLPLDAPLECCYGPSNHPRAMGLWFPKLAADAKFQVIVGPAPAGPCMGIWRGTVLDWPGSVFMVGAPSKPGFGGCWVRPGQDMAELEAMFGLPEGGHPYALTCLEKCLLPLQEKIFLRLAPARWFSQANGDSFPVLEHLLEGKPRAYRLDHLAKGKGKFPPAARVPRLPARCIPRGKVRAPGPEPCRSTTPQTACRRAMLWRSPGPAWAGDRVGLSA